MQPYPVRHLGRGVHVFGPHLEHFWPGHFAALHKRFVKLADATPDKSSQAHADAQRLIAMIAMDRTAFDALPDDDKPAFRVNMQVVELAPAGTGLLVYSPVPLNAALKAALDALGPVRVVVAPMSGHTAGLDSFRAAYPDALFVCPRGGGFLGQDLARQRPELGFRPGLADASSIANDEGLVPLLGNHFEVEVTQDNALFEIILYHRPSRTVLSSDTVYKPDAQGAGPGPGGPQQMYLSPLWFASAYQVLNLDPSPNHCLPDNRFFLAKHPQFDRVGLAASLRRVLAWEIDCLLCCHTDPLHGPLAKQAIHNSWGWLLECDG